MTKKEEFKAVEKTVEAYKTLSEDEALEKAKDVNVISEKLIQEEKGKAETGRRKFEGDSRWKNKNVDEEDVIKRWVPKTKLGRDVKEGRIKHIDEILDKNKKILEPEIVDFLIKPKSDLLSIGQAKGKFGGGKRRAWRQTQRKTKEGNVPTFSTMAVIGDENGHVGIGEGRASETLPARDKATRKAKLGIIKVRRDCAAFNCACKEPHTIPFKVIGKAGSVRVTFIPAPQGTGLVVGNELKKILKLAGIKDIYSRSTGSKKTTFNFAKACIDALKKTNRKEKEE